MLFTAFVVPPFSERSSSVELLLLLLVVAVVITGVPVTAEQATSSWWMVFAESSIGWRMRRRALMNLCKNVCC